MYVKRSLHKLHGHYNHVSPHQNSICTSCIPCISYVATTLLYLPTRIPYVPHASPAQVTWPQRFCISPPKFHMYIMRSLHKLHGYNTFVSPHQNSVCTYVHHAFPAQVTWPQHFCISPPKFRMYVMRSLHKLHGHNTFNLLHLIILTILEK